MTGLFRKEALDSADRNSLLGSVVLIRPLSFAVCTALVLAFVAGLIAFVFLGSYAHKQTAPGIVVPRAGLVKVYSPAGGIVRSLRVAEGEQVGAGAVLFVVSTERTLADNQGVQAIHSRELTKSIERLERQIEDERTIGRLRNASLAAQAELAAEEIEALGAEAHIQAERTRVRERELGRFDALLARGYVTRSARDAVYQTVLDARLRTRQLEREIAARHAANSRLEDERARLPVELEQALLAHGRSLSELRQRLADAQGGATYQVLAPVAGVATSLLARVGDTVRPDRPLASLVRPDAPLDVELYVPTNAAGFIQEGQEVRVRFDAFPYQRFGVHVGHVRFVSETTIIPRESALPIALSEPVYRVEVGLARQFVTARGRNLRLRAGMTVQADIVSTRSSIISWVLDPIYSLRGRS